MIRRPIRWFMRRRWWQKALIVITGVIGAGGAVYVALTLYSESQTNSSAYIRRWFDDGASRPDLTTPRELCPGAPFQLPSEGFIGLLWKDPATPYNVLRRHSGIDIFGDGGPGQVPVYAAYEGYLTRLADWRSSVIIRHDDPLEPGRVIWTYYTHMASREGDVSFIADDFPAGTAGVWVERGALLGYQGVYNGSSVIPVGLHVHFSIVQSEPDGSFKNESSPGNTLDPSPYFGMALNIEGQPDRPIRCDSAG